ncbi:MAG: hypothetical protein CMK46_05920 [Porticoccus sp.]|jgi:hypothetical protein|nr:hypothetical protein [Porticoccus sp.]PHQ56651.1 MAG: hypothetical protein COA29_04070 [Porticoccus sp.]|tara:strand:+ start:10712 stop:10969 length:258 start_codon:yes stop_codon:yes gene_type:complete
MATKPGYWTSLHGLATLTLIGTALYFLFVEHGVHVLPYLPFLIILLCPLMHLFMHKGHGEHQHQDAEEAYRRGLEKGRKEADKRR